MKREIPGTSNFSTALSAVSSLGGVALPFPDVLALNLEMSSTRFCPA